MSKYERWRREIDAGVDTTVQPATDFWRVRIWTGPSSVGEVWARLQTQRGLFRSGSVMQGTEHVAFDLHASDQTDAYIKAQDILTSVGLQSFGRPLGQVAGVQAWKVA